MAPPDRDVRALAGSELADGHRPVLVVEMEPKPTADHVDRLVLLLVVLERQAAPGLDHQDLAAVPVGQRPDQLVAPRLVDAARLDGSRRRAAGRRPGRPGCPTHLAHEPRTRRSPASISASRISAEVASV